MHGGQVGVTSRRIEPAIRTHTAASDASGTGRGSGEEMSVVGHPLAAGTASQYTVAVQQSWQERQLAVMAAQQVGVCPTVQPQVVCNCRDIGGLG